MHSFAMAMTNPFDNRATRLLHCRVPLVLAGMGGVARADLVAATTAAGGFGFLGMVREPVALIEREVARVRALGHHWFGVNIIPAATDPQLLDHQIAACIDLKIPIVGLFWEIDPVVVARLRQAGIVVVYQVGAVDEAIAAERAGAQLIIAQGCEAGGHVRGTTLLRDLLPAVVGAVEVPVLAAGGMASGADLVTALALGAEGIVLGTALMATKESFAHDAHKQALIAAQTQDTVLTGIFHINWPKGAAVRVLKSAVTSGAYGPSDTPKRTIIGDEDGRPIYLFSTDSPLRSMRGDFAAMALYAGTGIGQITAIVSAGERLDTIMDEATKLLADEQDQALPETASPVCYANEISGAYAGELSREEIAGHISGLLDDLQVALQLVLAAETGNMTSAPPFPQNAADHARWIVLVRDWANSLDLATNNHHRLAALPTEIGPALDHLQSKMLHGLASLVAGLPEGIRRRQLASLVSALEAQRPLLRPEHFQAPGRSG